MKKKRNYSILIKNMVVCSKIQRNANTYKAKDILTPKKDIDGYAEEKYGKNSEAYKEILDIKKYAEDNKIDDKLIEIMLNDKIGGIEDKIK